MADRRFAIYHHRALIADLIAPFLPHRLGLLVLDKSLYAILSHPRSIPLRALRHYSSEKVELFTEARRTEHNVGDVVMFLVRRTLISEEFSGFFLASIVEEGNSAVVGTMLRAGVRPDNNFSLTAAVSNGHFEVTKTAFG
ncbi:hypothetical protein M427DRAFT_182221 [Gonapodya prolifera JEL478]|uniref:Ankyrin n=1 Tax=Gonapodya prolifera (strain JEL478) TaxID=1344416 RepID=A0A139A0M5_GONPJ|nr:hypothetical protein M427DRAFT_182221 [Gonapodya prolifera JEL478]|eukprot:KXS10311.1 hypothetical protein M427DRAFT_182221 [Gonapodya prolifera JEL478]